MNIVSNKLLQQYKKMLPIAVDTCENITENLTSGNFQTHLQNEMNI